MTFDRLVFTMFFGGMLAVIAGVLLWQAYLAWARPEELLRRYRRRWWVGDGGTPGAWPVLLWINRLVPLALAIIVLGLLFYLLTTGLP